jgi:hypothetical protein
MNMLYSPDDAMRSIQFKFGIIVIKEEELRQITQLIGN